MATILYFSFAVFIVGLELITGCAVAGWAADKSIVVREQSPGPFWFAIALHTLLGIVLPLAVVCAT